MKSKEFGRPGGGVRPSRPPRSANALWFIYTERNTNTKANFYRPQRSWGKVMFLHVSVILFIGGSLQTPPWANTLLCTVHAGIRSTIGGTHPTVMHTCLLWPLSLLNVNIKMDSLWTHMEAMAMSLSKEPICKWRWFRFLSVQHKIPWKSFFFENKLHCEVPYNFRRSCKTQLTLVLFYHLSLKS